MWASGVAVLLRGRYEHVGDGATSRSGVVEGGKPPSVVPRSSTPHRTVALRAPRDGQLVGPIQCSTRAWSLKRAGALEEPTTQHPATSEH
jgi:hypothetical protein